MRSDSCLTCKFAEKVEETDQIKICRNELSGCFGTDVTVWEKCQRWEVEPPKEGER